MRCKKNITLIAALMILSISSAMVAPNFILLYLMLLTAFTMFLAGLILLVQEYTQVEISVIRRRWGMR